MMHWFWLTIALDKDAIKKSSKCILDTEVFIYEENIYTA